MRFFPLALLTLAWLVHAWSTLSARRCLVRGFWFGLGLFGAGVSWIYVSLHEFGGMPAVLAAFATFVVCAFLALFPATAGWLQARVPAGAAARALLVIPAAWTLAEWLRSWVFTGFPWLSLGYASVGWPLQGYAPIGGVFLLSFLTLGLAGAICLLARQGALRWISIGLIIAIAALGQALRGVAWSEPNGAPITVALLQGNIEQSLKFDPQRYAHTLETYAKLAEATQARLIVFPETAVPRFLDRVDADYLRRLQAIAVRNGGDLLLGVPTRRSVDEFFNSVIAFGTSRPQAYHKVHLVPFGEFVPPGFAWTLQLVNIPMSDFSRGARTQAPLRAAGEKLAVNICYEDAFGDEIAAQMQDATLLVNVSNVGWFGDSLAPSQHLDIARLRAIETARMHLAATNTGITAVIDRDGTVRARLPQFAEGRLDATAQGYSGATPYVRLRDWPIVVLSLVVLGAAIVIARRKVSR